MNCMEFRRLLDEGRLQANEHAAACERCASELRAAIEVERMLAAFVPAAARAGLEDEVLHRIRRRRSWHDAPAAFAQVLAEPVIAVSLALTLVLALQHQLLANALELLARMTLAHALLLAPLIAGVSWPIFRAVLSDLDAAGAEPGQRRTL